MARMNGKKDKNLTSRNRALGLFLFILSMLFYGITIVKFG